MALMFRQFLMTLGLSRFAVVGTVRSTDLDMTAVMEEDELTMPTPEGSEEELNACSEVLKAPAQFNTYRNLFSPVMEERYTFQKNGTDLFLAAQGKTSEVSLKAKGKRQLFGRQQIHWRVRRHTDVPKGSLPTYTLWNMARRRFLGYANNQMVALKVDSSNPAVHWNLVLNQDGETWRLVSAAGMTADTTMGARMRAVSGAVKESAAWKMKLVSSLLFNPTTDQEYPRQWKAVNDQPVWPGANLTWNDLCGSPGMPNCGTWQAWYMADRSRHVERGELTENWQHVVEVNRVKSMCDWGLGPISMFLSWKTVLDELRSSAVDLSGDTVCTAMTDEELKHAAKRSVIGMCYEDCLATLDEMLVQENQVSCDVEELEKVNFTAWFMNVTKRNPGCATLPYDTLEGLAEWTMKTKCFTWAPRSPVWLTEAKGPGAPNPVCLADTPGRKRQRREDLVQVGACPEGTSCNCPLSFLDGHAKIAAKLRLKAAGLLFVPSGTASVAVILQQFASSIISGIASTFVMGIIMNNPVALAVVARQTLGPPEQWFDLAMNLGSKVISAIEWSCSNSAGCYVRDPKGVRVKTGSKRRYRACRQEPKMGRYVDNPVWFMPPPGLKYAFAFPRGCRVMGCTTKEQLQQLVGFGAKTNKQGGMLRNVYNCQPLAWAEMQEEERKAFARELERTRVQEEYDISSV